MFRVPRRSVPAAGLALAVFLSVVAPAAVRAADAATTQPAPAAASPLDPLKKLAGEWEGKAGHDGETFDAGVSYRVTANGSAVMETLFPGTPHEMVTMYTVAGGRMTLTHYCAMGNQPRMRLARSSTADRLVFEYVPSPGIDAAKDSHMHSATIHIVDADHIESEWTNYQGGHRAGSAKFVLARKK